MKKNMSKTDRIGRVTIAAIFAILYFSEIVTGTFGLVLLVLAAVLALIGAIGFCPLYVPFGFSTFPKKE